MTATPEPHADADREGAFDEERLYVSLAAAYVRGTLPDAPRGDRAALAAGRAAGLRLHRYKRKRLPRVQRVLGALRGLGPSSLLDVGSGRGAFLWTLLDAFPWLPVTAIDLLPQRVEQLDAVRRGGVDTLRAEQADVTALPYEPGAFDGVTLLEVLEHLPAPERAAREVLRVARRFVVASVPSKPDDNPEHLRVFSPDDLRCLFLDAGAASVKVTHVLNHRLVVVIR